MQFRSKRKKNSIIDMTPLIDVVFQLLLFFMISTTFRDSPNFEVHLPEVSSDKLIQEDNSWTILITKDGNIVADNIAYTVETILPVMKDKVQTQKGVVLIIEADEEIAHGKVVQLMDLAEEAGIETLQIGAQSK